MFGDLGGEGGEQFRVGNGLKLSERTYAALLESDIVWSAMISRVEMQSYEKP